MSTPLFPSVIGHNVLDGGTDAQDGNAYPGPYLQDWAVTVANAAGVAPIRASDVGMRILGGRMESVVNTSGVSWTYRIVFEVKRPVRAISFLLAQGRTGATDTDAVNITGRAFVCAGLADAEIDAGAVSNFVTLTSGGSGTIAMPVPTVDTTRKCKWTDFVPVTQVPRSDGKPGAFVGVTVLLGAVTRAVLLGDGTDTFDSWRTKTDGGAVWLKYRTSASLGNASSTFTLVPTNTPVVGVRYITESGELVTNIADFRDSNGEGRDTYIGEGPLFWAAKEDAGDVAIEFSNLSWSATTSAQAAVHLTDAIADGVIPDFAFFGASLNDVGGTIDYFEAGPWADRIRKNIATCLSAGIQPVVLTLAPAMNATKALGSSDALRVAHNEKFVLGALARAGIPVVDASSAVSGDAHSSGQIELAPSFNLDGIHLTRAGQAAVGAVARSALNRFIDPR
jgi:lysophospholipase L1-like esterase